MPRTLLEAGLTNLDKVSVERALNAAHTFKDRVKWSRQGFVLGVSDAAYTAESRVIQGFCWESPDRVNQTKQEGASHAIQGRLDKVLFDKPQMPSRLNNLDKVFVERQVELSMMLKVGLTKLESGYW